MPSCNKLIVSGMGVTAAIGQGKEAFSAALFDGCHAFAMLERPGRSDAESEKFLGAEIGHLSLPARLTPRMARTASLSAQVAAATLAEAWEDAEMAQVLPERIGLVVGGSNVQQRELVNTYDSYLGRSKYLRPNYASNFFDTDLCGLCTEMFGIHGYTCTLGAASASGQMAVIHAAHMVQSGQLDVCIALGALMDLSYWECRALRSAGAMGSDRYVDAPDQACRPFDSNHDGFIYGESCAVVVIESADHALRRGAQSYAEIAGWGHAIDANRGTDPSVEGEVRAVRNALEQACVAAAEIDYINPHGTGSPLGDAVELRAVREAGLAHARINATKSITGHGLTAAGAVEIVACILQMQAARLHPSHNLDNPIDPDLRWVGKHAEKHTIAHCLNLSMGFGGINTALCLRHCEVDKAGGLT